MDLKTLQHAMMAAIRESQPDNLLPAIHKARQLTEQQSLSIYQNNYHEVLQNTLLKTFPVCEKIVGDDFFNACAKQYVHAHASVSFNLEYYGDAFPEFLETFEPCQSVPYLADMARLEWAWHCAYSGEDNVAVFDFSALAQLDENKSIVLTLPKSSTLLRSSYPIYRIWKINQDESDDTVNLNEGGDALFIWRSHYTMRVDVLIDGEYDILHWVKEKTPLADLCMQGLKHTPPISVIELLPRLVSQGWIYGFYYA